MFKKQGLRFAADPETSILTGLSGHTGTSIHAGVSGHTEVPIHGGASIPLGTLACTVLFTVMLFSCGTTREILFDPSHPGYTPSVWSGDAQVRTAYGSVRGSLAHEEVFVWKAIPYAKPPVGALRWKAPKAPDPWTGTMEKDDFCKSCIQYNVFPGGSISGSEDCLYLNIWRPATEQHDLPVYVWIHGGGNSSGAADQLPDYEGTSFCRRIPSVYVSLNYRLGPFGWFTHPAIRHDPARSREDASGNYGLLDILSALQWINKNIEAFGGDPSNVTVAGESAGGINIIALLMAPLSEGLFQKAVIRSGGIMSSSVETGDISSAKLLLRLLKEDGYKEANALKQLSGMEDDEIRAYLYSKSPGEIMSGYEPTIYSMISLPVLFRDGHVLPSEGAEVFQTGDYTRVPTLIGSNSDEVKLFLYWNRDLRKDKQLYRAATEYGSNLWKADGVDAIAQWMSSHKDQPAVYGYEFRWGSELDAEGNLRRSTLPCNRGYALGACHGLEIPFFAGTASTGSTLFNTIFFTNKNRRGRRSLEDAVFSYLELFLTASPTDLTSLKSLEPEDPSLPAWHPWSNIVGKPTCMLLDADVTDTLLEMDNSVMGREKAVEILKRNTTEDQFDTLMELLETHGPSIQKLDEYEEAMGIDEGVNK